MRAEDPATYFIGDWIDESVLLFFEFNEEARSLTVVVRLNSRFAVSNSAGPVAEYRLIRFLGVTAFRRVRCLIPELRDSDYLMQGETETPLHSIYAFMAVDGPNGLRVGFQAGSFGEVGFLCESVMSASIRYSSAGVTYRPDSIREMVTSDPSAINPFLGIIGD